MTRLPAKAERDLLARLLNAAPRAATKKSRGNQDYKAPVHAKPPRAAATGTPPLIVTVTGLPPTVNHMYVTTRGGGRVLSAAARAWYDRAVPAIREAAAGWAVPDGSLRLTIVLYHLPRSRDLDNALKAAQDAAAKALGFDDKRVDYLAVARGVGKPARTVYTLEAL